MNYILVVAATVLLALDFAISKQYQRSEGDSFTAGLRYNALNGLLTALIFLALSGFRPGFSLYSLLMAFAMSLCAMLYSILGLRVLKEGNTAIYSLFLMSGGMLLPYVFGLLFLNETLTIFRLLGVLMILAAVILSNRSKFRFQPTFYLFCAAVFLLNVMVSILSRCHQVNTAFASVSSTAFVMYSGVGKFVMSSVALAVQKKEKRARFSSGKVVPLIAGSALIGGVSYMLQLIGAKELPASVLYPIVTGGSIVFSALSGRVFFREKLTVYQRISIALCVIGTLLFL